MMKKMICLSIWFVSFFFFIVSVWAYQPFPDTGQTKCYNNFNVITCPGPGQPFYGQDAHYPRIPRSYTKLGYGGVVLADGASHVDDGGPWIMTRDNVTGLIWEVKTNANRYDGYSWSNALNVFISQLNAQNFGGFSDWRLPEVKELSSLVNRGNIKPAIDTSWFPKTALFADYWSSAPNKVSGSDVGIVDFNYGHASKSRDQESLLYVRAVRGGNNYPVNVFVDNGNGTVTDKITGLMWQKERAPGQFTWRQALEYTSTLILAGYPDWRLPNINELQTLIDYSTTRPAIYPIFKPHTENQGYWSSTTYLGRTGYGFPYSWVVDFRFGSVSRSHKQLWIYSVRAVRTTQETVLTDLEKANIIFNWLESEFPEILSPPPQPTHESDGIYFRYYPGTNVYIGTIQNDLYFYDHLGVLHNLGGVDIWLPYAKGVK